MKMLFDKVKKVITGPLLMTALLLSFGSSLMFKYGFCWVFRISSFSAQCLVFAFACAFSFVVFSLILTDEAFDTYTYPPSW